MTDFTIAGHVYRSSQLNALSQFHVLRRLGPVLSSFSQIVDVADAAQAGDVSAVISALEPIMLAVSQMADDDVNYVIKACLGVVQRQIEGGKGWQFVWPDPRASNPQFSDIDMGAMLQMVMVVLRDNMTNFSSALRSTLGAAGQET